MAAKPPPRAKSPSRGVTFQHVARATGRPLALVRRILKEDPKLVADREIKDDVFRSARALGYDFQTLRMGKRLEGRQAALAEVLAKILENPEWDRRAILNHLRNAVDLSQRLQKRMFGKDA